MNLLNDELYNRLKDGELTPEDKELIRRSYYNNNDAPLYSISNKNTPTINFNSKVGESIRKLKDSIKGHLNAKYNESKKQRQRS